MRNISKGKDLCRLFPIYAIENNCIINRMGEVTAGFRVTLPEAFTLSADGYSAIHGAWVKALRVLPDYTVIHRQDIYTRERYESREGVSYLSSCYEKHFGGRSRMQSIDSILMTGNLVPPSLTSCDRFLDAVGQAEKIINDSGFIRLDRYTADDLTGTKDKAGLYESYMNLSGNDRKKPLEDIVFDGGGMRIGDKRMCMHTLSFAGDLPEEAGTDMRYEKYSTENSDCLLSFASPLGLLLETDHTYNQYLFIENRDDTVRALESLSGKMYSLQQLSSNNLVNREFIDHYIETVRLNNLTPVRCHFNVMAWAETDEELRRVRNLVGSAMTQTGCLVRHNTVDCPVLFWSSIPGNGGDFPREETFLSFLETGVCFFTGETNYLDSPSDAGLKFSDRISGKPVLVDMRRRHPSPICNHTDM
ncbi:MAG: TraG family conjugative transposon ATPase [Tannerellaceae bacterium]|jgi:conjugation system TraG family ATPase|nr:TraG family conjugative transposon ATPase [Tannerellaceae bacterium]